MRIKDIGSDSVTIEWNKPSDDGGLDISSYQVERCNVGKMIWSKVADVGHDFSAYSVQKLHEDAEYMFRVCAQNAVGASEFLESEPVTVKCRYREYTTAESGDRQQRFYIISRGAKKNSCSTYEFLLARKNGEILF